jgi:DNA (cytosine-5)-methyltransferase 1
MRVLNLFAGIGGNRKLWEDVEVTAVELDETIANIYQDNFPDDLVILGDAHQFLLDHYMNFDFIWASPPCQSHSRARFWGDHKPIYPDMMLYEEILFLQHHYKGLFCVENVVGYYPPLVKPQSIGRHYFWANFYITEFEEPDYDFDSVNDLQRHKGFDISGYSGFRKDAVLRSAIYPPLGLHVLDCARGFTQQTLGGFIVGC